MRDFIPFIGTSGGSGIPALSGPRGMMPRDIDEFRKAVTAGHDVSPADLVGGAALRTQSLEPLLLRTIQQDKHFVGFNLLTQTNATATVDEFTVKRRIGGWPGSAYNAELGSIPETQGDYKREVGLVKFLMTRRQVSVVQQSQKTIVDAITEEKLDATLELKTSVEHGIWYGKESCSALEFDGIDAIIEAEADGDLTKDARGEGLSYIAQEVIDIAAAVASYGRFGTVTDLFCSPAVQAREFDQKLDPAVRIVPVGRGSDGTKIGTPVVGINTSNGAINMRQDVFIHEGEMPWEVRPGDWASLVTAAGLTAVTVCSVAVNADAASQFTGAHAGNYYYGVEAEGKLGRSTTFITLVAAVASGDAVTLVITNPADANVTAFWIHRSRRGGTNNKNDVREMVRVARTAGASTTYVDRNQKIPGTSTLWLLNLRPGENAIGLRRLLPMTMFPLFPTDTATHPWAQLFFCYLRVPKRKHHGRVINVLPGGANWRPF